MVARVGGAANYKTAANVMVEIQFEGKADPSNEADVVFSDPAGKQLRVPAFWAGGQSWKVRYASPVVGTHRYKAEALEGVVEVEPYKGGNPLYVHGPLRVDKT